MLILIKNIKAQQGSTKAYHSVLWIKNVQGFWLTTIVYNSLTNNRILILKKRK